MWCGDWILLYKWKAHNFETYPGWKRRSIATIWYKKCLLTPKIDNGTWISKIFEFTND